MRAAPLLLLLLAATPAAGHVTEEPVRPGNLWSAWSFDPWIVVPLVFFVALYLRGVARVWARAGGGRVIARWRIRCWGTAVLTLVAALVAPLDALADTLLSAHMVQHMLLVAVAPPLLLLGAPAVALTWALPPKARTLLQRPAPRTIAKVLHSLCRPVPATILHALAIWIWHAPPAFHAALEHEWVHTAEHLSFLITALFFWQSILLSARRPALTALGALGAFATFVHSGLLGGLLSLAPAPLYASYVGRTEIWGISALADQQLAGLIMWVPIGPIYLAAVLALVWRLTADASQPRSRGVPSA